MAMGKATLSLLVHLHAALLFLPAEPAAVYDVVARYGARGDGASDSTAPFLRAWADACRSPRRHATVRVPPGNYLLAQPATFLGPCAAAAVTFSLDANATLLAPPRYAWESPTGRWITFESVVGLTFTGGTLDGRGAALWQCKGTQPRGHCPTGASSLTISNSREVVVEGVRSVNSGLFHFVVLQSSGVTVRRVRVDAPGDSPNTDGIHVHKSRDVAVYDADVRTGDDCVSVGPGNSNLWIERVSCGPGHGISIGSLGKQQGMAVEAVENVTVKTTWFTNTTNGLRIKTWVSSKRGYVRGVTFSDSTMSGVGNPIIIDQHYCPDGGCSAGAGDRRSTAPRSSGIKISEVEYVNVRGSSATPVAVSFDCSRSNPCSGIRLRDVRFTYQKSLEVEKATASCRNAQGTASGLVVPPSCL
uniref:Exopolygalacturonase n=1 Tax=Leersia perrieri TaxID=77586 RepID=A0A0D9V8U9_9ORYZ